jgi:nitroreductase
MTHQSVSADQFVSLLKSLRAVRQFADKPLPAEAVRDIHEVIRWSGNASNRQEFQVLWIEDRATLRRLADQKRRRFSMYPWGDPSGPRSRWVTQRRARNEALGGSRWGSSVRRVG